MYCYIYFLSFLKTKYHLSVKKITKFVGKTVSRLFFIVFFSNLKTCVLKFAEKMENRQETSKTAQATAENHF
jgi:hypothetical protein